MRLKVFAMTHYNLKNAKDFYRTSEKYLGGFMNTQIYSERATTATIIELSNNDSLYDRCLEYAELTDSNKVAILIQSLVETDLKQVINEEEIAEILSEIGNIYYVNWLEVSDFFMKQHSIHKTL